MTGIYIQTDQFGLLQQLIEGGNMRTYEVNIFIIPDNSKSKKWCRREDSNLHGIAPTNT